MNVRIVFFALAATLVSATGAHAGKALSSGPVLVNIGDTMTCAVVNVSGKDLSDIQVSIFKAETGPSETNTSCATEAATGICGVQTAVVSGGYRFCSVTLSGSTKALRGNLCNLDTGDCSDLR